MITTGLSGNEVYCLAQKGYKPGNLAIGNTVYSLGALRKFSSGMQSMFGGELSQITEIIKDGRDAAYQRLMGEVKDAGGIGVTGVTSELIYHSGNVEFLSVGSVVDADDQAAEFSSSCSGQELFAAMDAGCKPITFAFGNVAYSLGVVGGVTSALKSFVRGEINELTTLIYDAREHALGLVAEQAKSVGADDVVGVKTYVYQLGNGLIEFLAIGTAVKKVKGVKTESKQLPPQVVSSKQDMFYDSTDIGDVSASLNQPIMPSGNMRRLSRSFLSLGILIIVVIVLQIFHLNGN